MTRSWITSLQSFNETSNHPGDSALYSPDLVPWNFWLFPKLKSPLKGKRFHTFNEIQENTTGQLMVTGRTVWGPKVPTLKGDWGIIVLCTMFLVFCILFSKCFYFSYYMAGYLLDRPHMWHVENWHSSQNTEGWEGRRNQKPGQESLLVDVTSQFMSFESWEETCWPWSWLKDVISCTQVQHGTFQDP